MSVFVADGTVRHAITPIGTVSASGHWRPVSAPAPNLIHGFLVVAPYVSRPPRELTHIVRQILETTGWSYRVLASVIGTTHPTISAIKQGHEPARRTDLADALIKTAEVVAKLSQLADGDQARLKTLLKTPGPSGDTPLRLLAEGRYGKAYLVAMDLLGRRREAGKLLDTALSRRPSKDICALSDEDLDDD